MDYFWGDVRVDVDVAQDDLQVAGSPPPPAAGPGRPVVPVRLAELFSDLPPTVTVDAVATQLGVTKQTVYKWINSGEAPAYRIRGEWLILRDEIVDWVAAGANACDRSSLSDGR